MLGINLKSDLNNDLTRIIDMPIEYVDSVNAADVFDSDMIGGFSISDIKDGTITDQMLADASVTTEKLANLAVDSTKLANLAVDAAKLANSSVESTKIASAAVGSAAIASAAVGTAHIANGAIINAHIQDATIQSAKIGSLNADVIDAGTITGRTLRTIEPGAATGSAVVIEGGTSQFIKFFHNTTQSAFIRSFQHTSGEDEYLKIEALSGRLISFRESQVAVNGNLVPTSDNSYDCGTGGQRWRKGYFEDIQVDDLNVVNTFSGCGSISGCAYIEVNLLGDKKESYKDDIKKGKKISDKNYTGFEEGDVLVYGSDGLKKSSLDTCNCVSAVSDKNGMPIVLGAEKIKVIGKVTLNQFLVTSPVEGIARAWNGKENPPIGTVIAQAMERKNDNKEGLIMAMIRKM